MSENAMIGAGMLAALVVLFLVIALRGGKVRGFWNDEHGLELDEVGGAAIMGLVVYTGIKFSNRADLTGAQVDFFMALVYAMLAIILKTVIVQRGWPTIGIGGYRRPPDDEPKREVKKDAATDWQSPV